MARHSYIQIGGKLYEKGVDVIPELETRPTHTVMPDLPDFVSPIDGQVVRGRAGMRDHCARHNVVPTAELKGLPVGHPRYVPDRAAIREELKKQYYK